MEMSALIYHTNKKQQGEKKYSFLAVQFDKPNVTALINLGIVKVENLIAFI